MKYVMTIAGSDSIGGAGIQADIRTITSLGAHALTVITAVTAQNSLGVNAIEGVSPGMVSKQIETILRDVRPDAVKIGMVLTRDIIQEVIRMMKGHRLSMLVIDPVIKTSTGVDLIEPDAGPLFREALLPLATVITPNLSEAGWLAGGEIRDLEDMRERGRMSSSQGGI
jgi:hydroxymethylpyrimidine/phosphomethylpyrimidine kinase